MSIRINIKTNIKEATKDMSRLQRKQIPFATANTINEIIGVGRKYKGKGLDGAMAKQMIKKLDRPRPQTTRAFFRIPANKKRLEGVLGFLDWAAKFMKYQIEGGVRSSGDPFGVPTGKAKLNTYGNIPGKKSGLIKKKNQKIAEINNKLGVWEIHKQRTRSLIIHFQKAVTYKAKFPFFKIADNYVQAKFIKTFSKHLDKALRTAK